MDRTKISIVGGGIVFLNRAILALSAGGGTTIVVLSNDLLNIRLWLVGIAIAVGLAMLKPDNRWVRAAMLCVIVGVLAAAAFWPSVQTGAPIVARNIESIALSPWGLFTVFLLCLEFLYFVPEFPSYSRQRRARIFPILVEQNTQSWTNPPRRQLNNIVNKTFRHQEIIIDNNEYIDCTFDGVTLVYLGIGPTRIIGSVLPGLDGQPNISFKSSNATVVATSLILRGAGFISDEASKRLEVK